MNRTNTYNFPDAKGIVVCGDIHGDYEALVCKCCVQYSMTDTLIVVAGDCGFGFKRPDYYEDIYQKVSSRLAKANNWIVFIRGNHDNPAYFDGRQVNYKRWKAVPDYSVLKACGHTVLCIGGAVSVDRKWRKERMIMERHLNNDSYKVDSDNPFAPGLFWPDERPVYNDERLKAIDRQYAIDVVISHTAPSFCEMVSRINIQDWLIKDKGLLDDVKNERKVMDDIHAYLYAHSHPLQQWYYGHFHESWHGEIDGIKYQMLDIMQLHKLAPDDDAVNKQSCDEYNEKIGELAKLVAKFPIF